MSDLSPLSEEKQKLDFGDVRAVDDPCRKSAIAIRVLVRMLAKPIGGAVAVAASILS
jgi:hypothetical protein